MSNIINLNSEQRTDLLTVAEQLDILVEEVVLLKDDNEHLRQRLDQAQEANYLLEGDLSESQKRLVDIKYKQACERFRKPKLGDRYRTLNEYLDSFNGDVERMTKAKRNWNKLTKKILESEES